MSASEGLSWRTLAEALAAILLLAASSLSGWCLYNEHQTSIELATMKAERSAACEKIDSLKQDVSSMRTEMDAGFKELNKRLTDHMLSKVAGE